MATNPPEFRQTMRCGLMPVAEGVGLAWGGHHGLELDVCAGYTTALPDVIDVAATFAHWENGALDLACAGEQPPQSLIDGLSIFKAAIHDREWREHEKAKQKGGG